MRLQRELGAQAVVERNRRVAGDVVEVGSVYDTFERPKHPYSQRLIGSIPTLGGARTRLEAITGTAPSPLAWPSGCRFHPRCPHVMDICRSVMPKLREVAPGQQTACHLYNDVHNDVPEADKVTG